MNAAHVLGRADRRRAARAGLSRPTSSSSTRPDWRYLAYHLAGADIAVVVRGGEVVWPTLTRGAA